MAQSAGSGFVRGFGAGTSIRQNKQLLEQRKEEADAKQRADKTAEFQQIKKDSEESAVEAFNNFTSIASKLAPHADDPAVAEQLEAMQKGAQSALMQHGQFLEQIRAQATQIGFSPEDVDNFFPSGAAWVEQRLPEFDAQVQTAISSAPQFEDIPPAKLPEGLPEGAVVQRNTQNNELRMVFDPTDNPSALEERKRLFIEAGATNDQAAGLAAGRFVVMLDPVTREGRVFDKIAQQFIGEPLQAPTDTESEPVVPPGTETPAATGLGGAFRNAVNIVTDAIGAGVQAEKTQEATDAMNLVQVTTKLALQVAIPGRPAKDIRDDLKRLTVTPNSLFVGEDRARSKLDQMLRFIDNNIAEKQAAIDAGGLKPADVSLLQNNVRELNQMKEAHEDLIAGFGDQSELSPEVEAAVKRALGE